MGDLESDILTDNSTLELSFALVGGARNYSANSTASDDDWCLDIRKHVVRNAVSTVSYIVGICGNAAALYILWSLHRAKRPRSGSKHALMLSCLVGNDLVALLGMLVQLAIVYVVPCHLLSRHLHCVARVFWRLFGLGSGCVAAVMALERWLALTHPFVYQKHVTVQIILLAIFILWIHVLVLVCLPFVGFGLYRGAKDACVRYREATEPKDIAYAFLYFTFGTLLCCCIVWCNLAVVRALCHMNVGKWNGSCSGVGRRISRQSLSSSSTKQLCNRRPTNRICTANTSTTRVTEHSNLDLNTPDLSQNSSGAERSVSRQSSSQRLLKTSFRSGGHGSQQCNCISCSPKPVLVSGARNNSKDKFNDSGNQQLLYNVCTSEEVAFARLMTVLSISFVVCWAPQMISILLAQFSARPDAYKPFYILADVLMALHFTMDPYVYVVLRSRQRKQEKKPCMPILKLFCRQCSEQSQTTNEVELTEKCISQEEIS